MLKPLTLAAVLTLAAAPALAQIGSAAMPIEIKMKRGTDRITVRGDLVQNGPACCTYVFKVRAGQRLYWSESGAAVRMVITYPDGNADGPGLPNPQPLPQGGVYTLAISPDLMAEGAFGPYVLRLRIPPK
jgi:hypothetical protein